MGPSESSRKLYFIISAHVAILNFAEINPSDNNLCHIHFNLISQQLLCCCGSQSLQCICIPPSRESTVTRVLYVIIFVVGTGLSSAMVSKTVTQKLLPNVSTSYWRVPYDFLLPFPSFPPPVGYVYSAGTRYFCMMNRQSMLQMIQANNNNVPLYIICIIEIQPMTCQFRLNS